jgi:cytochrome c
MDMASLTIALVLNGAAAACYLGPLAERALIRQDQPTMTYGIGRAPDAARLAAWDLDVSPDGSGLPAGQAIAADGEALYAATCAACHGLRGEGGVNDVLAHDPQDAGFVRIRATPKAIGNYWPYATTLFDYIRRAMPHTAPGSLTDQQVYALTAYLLHLNGLISAAEVIDARTLPAIEMPARSRVRRYNECEEGTP